MSDKYKTVEKKIEAKEADNGHKYEVTILNAELDIEKKDYKDKDKDAKVKVKVIDKGTDGKGTAEETFYVEKCKVERGFFSDSVKLPKELKSGIVLKEELYAAVEGGNWTFHATYSVLAALLLGGLVGGYLASRKEDKEEESL